MAQVLADPALYTFTGGEPPTPDALRARYARQVAGPDDPGTEWLNWVVRVDRSGRLAGYVQATVTNRATGGATADVAWVVGTEWQGQGIAREAALGMRRLLARHGVRDLTAHIHPEHTASSGVARALGLTPSGEADEDGEIVWRGRTDGRPAMRTDGQP
ncbi:GNAT family N-acetyltransferase [Streptomyces sp. VRA16 Mangrove soil]|nr:GNAT family N-acetyltransferase [Streptomyces sp. VRA16 Mangrove soil]